MDLEQLDSQARSNLSVMLVEDQPENLQPLVALLRAEGYQVRPIAHGQAVLNAAKQAPPDLILLDIDLPGLNGYEICQQLKASTVTDKIPVIFLSSQGNTADKHRAFEAGGVDFIAKPFHEIEFLARIKTQLTLRYTQLQLEQEIGIREAMLDELKTYELQLDTLVAERTQQFQKRNLQLQNEITERAEVELLYRRVMEECFDGIFIHRQGLILYANPQFGKILLSSVDQLLGSNLYTRIVPEARVQVEHNIMQGERGAYETEFLRSDGTVVQAEVVGTPCTYQGHNARIVAVRDISQRYEDELRLRASEKKYSRLFFQFKSLLDAISDPLALLSLRMKPIWTNKAYDLVCAELDCEKRYAGLTFFQLDESSTESTLLRCLKTGEMVEGTMKTHDERTWGIKAYPLKDDSGSLVQIIASAVNITEKVILREEASRSSRLASLGEMAAGIAHEINNPNAIILLNNSILRRVMADAMEVFAGYHRDHGDFSLGGLDYATMWSELELLPRRIEDGSVRIKRIVEDLKTFVREESRKDIGRLGINLVVETAIRMMVNTITKSTANFSVSYGENLPEISGSFQKLEQVVINLIQNACQALTDPSQKIKVTTSYAPDTEMVMVQVIDQGEGVAPEIQDRLTDPFFTTKRSRGGTGLGLSVSSRILREHDGRLLVESVPGEGATFTMLLPILLEGEV